MGRIHIITIIEGKHEVQYTDGDDDVSVVVMDRDGAFFPGTVLPALVDGEWGPPKPEPVIYEIINNAFSRSEPFVGADILKVNRPPEQFEVLEIVEDMKGVPNSKWMRVLQEFGENSRIVYIAIQHNGKTYAKKVD